MRWLFSGRKALTRPVGQVGRVDHVLQGHIHRIGVADIVIALGIGQSLGIDEGGDFVLLAIDIACQVLIDAQHH